MKLAANQLVAILSFVAASAAYAHGGEEHDHDAPPPAPSQRVAPHAAAASEEFEVVAQVEGGKLLLYVDRFESNAPVTQARVEVDGAGLHGPAGESAPGIYVLDLATPLPAARHALTISIDAGDSSDLLSATLDTSLAAPAAAHVHGRGEWLVWIVAALLLFAAAALLAVRRRRKNKGF